MRTAIFVSLALLTIAPPVAGADALSDAFWAPYDAWFEESQAKTNATLEELPARCAAAENATAEEYAAAGACLTQGMRDAAAQMRSDARALGDAIRAAGDAARGDA